jgi:F-type H+/Na+-transporting ATPase subunit beta
MVGSFSLKGRYVMPKTNLTVPVGETLLGHMLNASGEPIDGSILPPDTPRRSIESLPSIEKVTAASDEFVKTGIKVIDLLAPFPRNGTVHVISAWGLGRIVLFSELTRNLSVVYGGYTVFVGVEERPREWLDVTLQFRQCGMADKVVSVLVQSDDPPEIAHQALLTGLTIARHFRDQSAKEILFIVDQRVLTGEIRELHRQIEALKQNSMISIISGFHDSEIDSTPIIPPDLLDGTVVFSRTLAEQRLHPAIDPLLSSSRALKPEIVGPTHFQVAQNVYKMFQREHELHKTGQPQNVDILPERDQQLVARARRLRSFLTQPLFVAQLATAIPGEYVQIEDTVAGCQALINGQYDHLPEELFNYVGTIEQAIDPASPSVPITLSSPSTPNTG